MNDGYVLLASVSLIRHSASPCMNLLQLDSRQLRLIRGWSTQPVFQKVQ